MILPDFSILDYILIAAFSSVFIYEVVYYAVFIAGAPRWIRRHRSVEPDSAFHPGVSIIVCARNEEDNLRVFLQALLSQDYPEYELIVVNDGSEDHTREVIEDYMHRDSRVRMTFVPLHAHVGSTKKLAITLGAKGARYDYLLLTDADCRPESKYWIREMMQPFANLDTEIVLGYGAYFEEDSRLNRMINFDTLFGGLNYLGASMAHCPYMGVGRNLAYRKSFFERTGGFSGLMTFRSGDDDLFVNRVATSRNTAVVASPDSLTWSLSKQTFSAWLQQKRRHLSVSSAYSTRSKIHLGLEPVMRLFIYALPIVMAVLVYMRMLSIWVLLGAVALLLVRLILQVSILNTAARRMHLRRPGLSVCRYDIILPLINLYIFITKPFHRVKNRW